MGSEIVYERSTGKHEWGGVKNASRVLRMSEVVSFGCLYWVFSRFRVEIGQRGLSSLCLDVQQSGSRFWSKIGRSGLGVVESCEAHSHHQVNGQERGNGAQDSWGYGSAGK